MGNKITRRQFLKILTLSGTATGLTVLTACHEPLARTIAQVLNTKNYLPIVKGGQVSTPTPANTPTPIATLTKTPKPTTTPPSGSHKVVHVHHANATSWNFSTGWYGDYINQQVVNQMMNEGLKTLTEKLNIGEAWNALLSGYQSGKAIAIKVNFNNNFECEDNDNKIDALIAPVNALILGMLDVGVLPSDIWVFDISRPLPLTRFRAKCLYPGVRFFDNGCPGTEPATFNSSDPNAKVTFQESSLTPRQVGDVIINASYVINMPILKDHVAAGVSLGFKNHFGTIDSIVRGGDDNLHYFIDPTDPQYSSTYNPMVEIFANHHILNKTILTVGDGLFGAIGSQGSAPTPWSTFGGKSPNSLFLSIDPVAIDCVMLDILDAEPGDHPRRPGASDYLKIAAGEGMGVYEDGDPWGSGYQNIDYLKIELP
jgi:hypothetical protein